MIKIKVYKNFLIFFGKGKINIKNNKCFVSSDEEINKILFKLFFFILGKILKGIRGVRIDN